MEERACQPSQAVRDIHQFPIPHADSKVHAQDA
jgi:hypothetical protein